MSEFSSYNGTDCLGESMGLTLYSLGIKKFNLLIIVKLNPNYFANKLSIRFFNNKYEYPWYSLKTNINLLFKRKIFK